MNQQAPAVFTARDLEEARAQGTLAGEVRVLKWGTGIAIVAIIGALGLLYQNQVLLHERVTRVDERLVQVEERLVRVEERVTRVEERLVRVEERLDHIEVLLARISAQMETLNSRQSASR